MPDAFSILIVEDEPVSCEILSSLFAMRYPAATIFCADNGMSGKKNITEQQPDIIVSDISLPDISGIQMLSEVSAGIGNAHIIVVTAHSSRHLLNQFSSLGIKVDLITKPIDFGRLLTSIDSYLATAPRRSTSGSD